MLRSLLFATLTLTLGIALADGSQDSPSAWEAAGLSYPKWLGQQFSGQPDKLVCATEGVAHEQEAAKTRLAWRGTEGFLVDLPVNEIAKNIDKVNSANGMMSGTAWNPVGDYIMQYMFVLLSPSKEIYQAELRAAGETKAVICMTTYGPR